ncbi:DUF4231 domain-containing protein [Paractinoplanes rishiriensis]|uniref:Membrane protein n=1 Tax=Paractinoplanes rishiriensis TaxID=1050105 RepID=A0A919KB13_9ACTN|nr:DUF4231 domain-containing protein [Actinoplanes rishiriensis]GIF01824.1 membrane protein [Actinoplanes rishiriensis]
MAETRVEETFPEIFRTADGKAVDEQGKYFRLVRYGLIAAVVAAVGNAITKDVTLGTTKVDTGGVLSAVAFIFGFGFALYLLLNKPERAWYECRAATESIKTLAWQYAMRGGSFDQDRQHDERLFGQTVRKIISHLRYAGLPTIGGSEGVTQAMNDFRDKPLPERRQIYLQQRILDQNHWYANRAKQNQRRAQRWFLTAIVFHAIGVILAVLKALNVIELDLLGIAATAAAGAIAWVQTRDSQTLAESYVIASHELAAIHGEAQDHTDALTEAEWSAFVRSGEQAISREHTLWLARRDPNLSAD